MKTSAIAAILASAGIAFAAPTEEKRDVSGSVTLFPNTNYGGTGFTISFTVSSGTCVAPNLPASINNQASSVRLSGENAGFYCRLYDGANCDANSAQTFFFSNNIPNLADLDQPLDNAASSLWCAQQSG